MDFIELEKQFENLSKDCFSKLTAAEAELREEIEKAFRNLSSSSENESEVLDGIKAAIENEIRSFRASLAEIRAEISALRAKKEGPMPDLEAELTQEAEANIQPLLSELRKKRADIGQKISVLKRELANFHKENNSRLIEEEKHFKTREAELDRRLGIDLDRKNEANIKAYSEYEKRLLATDDEAEILELKEKIKEIRIAGVKELTKIRDNYAFLHFENRLDFKKFSERVVFENSLKAEETKTGVRVLEAEREKTERAVESERQKAAFAVRKKLLEKERDYALAINREQLEKELAILDLERKAAEAEAQSQDKRDGLWADFRKEASKFDRGKTDAFALSGDVFLEKLKASTDVLTNHLQVYVHQFQGLLLSLLQAFEEESRKAHERFQDCLWIPKLEPEGAKFLQEYKNLLETSFRKRLEMYEEAAAFLKGEIKEIINRIKGISLGLSHRREELQKHETYCFLELKALLNKGYQRLAEEAQPARKPAPAKADFRQKRDHIRKDAEKRNQVILAEYSRKLEKLEAESAAYFEALKKEEQRKLKEDKAFLKKSRKRQRELKKNFSANLSQYEKDLFAIYKNELEKNQFEEKERIKKL